jgi:hypothetical protein
MKKAIVFSLVMAFLSLGMSACKTHERCPAYGDSGQTSPVKDKA